MQPTHRIVLAVGLTALSASSFAVTTVYTSSAPFLANVAPGAYTETFNSAASSAGSASFASGGFGYTISAPSGLFASGEFLGTSQINQPLTITFTSGNVNAVGGNFYATNISDAFQATALTLTLSDSTTVTFTPTSVANSYRGFTSDLTVTSLTISAPGGSLYAGLDNLTVGVAAVPEPTSVLLMGVGLAALWLARQRKS